MMTGIKEHLRTEGLFDNISLASLLSSLHEAGQSDLASEIEEAMSDKNIPSSTRVATFLSMIGEDEASEDDDEENEEDEEE